MDIREGVCNGSGAENVYCLVGTNYGTGTGIDYIRRESDVVTDSAFLHNLPPSPLLSYGLRLSEWTTTGSSIRIS